QSRMKTTLNARWVRRSGSRPTSSRWPKRPSVPTGSSSACGWGSTLGPSSSGPSVATSAWTTRRSGTRPTSPRGSSPSASAGKSRLLYEFLRGIEEHGVIELETTCASYGRAIPYRPVLEILGRYLDLAEGMPAEEVKSRIAERLQELGLQGEEPAILLAHFAGAFAPPEFVNSLSGAELKERTL